MSWMDSWSRPGKHSAVPPPLYSTQGDSVKYCHTCGRVMTSAGSSKHATTKTEEKKYCSSRCRSLKPGPHDRRIEAAFVALLDNSAFEGDDVPESIRGKKTKPLKGEPRAIVPCSAAEELIYGSRHDPAKTHGRKKNRASRVIGGEHSSGDDDDDPYSHGRRDKLVEFTTTGFAGKVRPPQTMAELNASVGGEKGRAERTDETEEAEARRKEGMRITEEKERVKRAARRGVVFGFAVNKATANGVGKTGRGPSDNDGQARRKCEAIMNGTVIEPSFAKGDWGIRWRES